MPNLVVSCRFNPPVIHVLYGGGGAGLREETIHRLDRTMFQTTTTSMSPKQEPPKFEYVSSPPHWVCKLENQYCDHIGRSNLFLSLIEALESEDWVLQASHACTHNYSNTKSVDTGMDTTRLFFHRP
eukprot:GGOE01060638.1.p1 GENE.GGOE01060638.1~~GGOE01060638.1.p1  ORF type:complete len:138 (-),score=11.97 GGOE01060638.1:155-535(-)